MKSLFSACGGVIIAAVFAMPAAAQEVGTYNGTSADGQSVSFTVSIDPNTSAKEITGATVWFLAACKNSTYSLNEGEGWGPNVDVAANHKVSATFSVPGFFNIFSLKFAADGSTATGTTETLAPYLDPANSPPKKSLFCESRRQTLSLTYAGSDARAPTAHSQLVYDRKGRVIGEVLQH
jgi:hypothetical protein